MVVGLLSFFYVVEWCDHYCYKYSFFIFIPLIKYISILISISQFDLPSIMVPNKLQSISIQLRLNHLVKNGNQIVVD